SILNLINKRRWLTSKDLPLGKDCLFRAIGTAGLWLEVLVALTITVPQGSSIVNVFREVTFIGNSTIHGAEQGNNSEEICVHECFISSLKVSSGNQLPGMGD